MPPGWHDPSSSWRACALQAVTGDAAVADGGEERAALSDAVFQSQALVSELCLRDARLSCAGAWRP
jgi:hypothetical protein